MYVVCLYEYKLMNRLCMTQSVDDGRSVYIRYMIQIGDGTQYVGWDMICMYMIRDTEMENQ